MFSYLKLKLSIVRTIFLDDQLLSNGSGLTPHHWLPTILLIQTISLLQVGTLKSIKAHGSPHSRVGRNVCDILIGTCLRSRVNCRGSEKLNFYLFSSLPKTITPDLSNRTKPDKKANRTQSNSNRSIGFGNRTTANTYFAVSSIFEPIEPI